MGAFLITNPNPADKFVFGTGQRLTGSPAPLPSSFEGALLCTEYGSSRDSNHIDKKLSTITKLLKMHKVRGIRSVGTAAISMCLVAQGSADFYYEAGTHAWDVAAGAILAWKLF